MQLQSKKKTHDSIDKELKVIHYVAAWGSDENPFDWTENPWRWGEKTGDSMTRFGQNWRHIKIEMFTSFFSREYWVTLAA